MDLMNHLILVGLLIAACNKTNNDEDYYDVRMMVCSVKTTIKIKLLPCRRVVKKLSILCYPRFQVIEKPAGVSVASFTLPSSDRI